MKDIFCYCLFLFTSFHLFSQPMGYYCFKKADRHFEIQGFHFEEGSTYLSFTKQKKKNRSYQSFAVLHSASIIKTHKKLIFCFRCLFF